MKSDKLQNALGKVDPALIARADEPKKNSVFLMRIVPIAAAVAILAAGILAVFSMANRNKPTVPGADEPIVVPPVGDTEPERTNTIVEGAFEIYGSNMGTSEKIQGPFDIAVLPFISSTHISCLLKSEKIFLNISTGAFITTEDVNDFTRLPFMRANFNRAESKIISYFECQEKIEYPTIKNGQKNNNGTMYYEKNYTVDDLDSIIIKQPFTISKDKENRMYVFDPELPLKNMLEFDFSKNSKGSVGRINISLCWSDPINDELKRYSYSSADLHLYFCVGENYVGFSFKNADDAIINLAKVECTDFDSNSEDEIKDYLRALFK